MMFNCYKSYQNKRVNVEKLRMETKHLENSLQKNRFYSLFFNIYFEDKI